MDHQPRPCEPLRELALFAGAGGGILGGSILGWRTVCAVEFEPYAASVLVARQNDGSLPPFPIWDDIRDFDGRPWRGCVDVISGGFPCQDLSVAGKGAGLQGSRSSLWYEMARIIDQVRPEFVFVENSPMLLTSRRSTAVLVQMVAFLFGKERIRSKSSLRLAPDGTAVLGFLSEIGYDAAWTTLGANDVGAPHKRNRAWILGRRREDGVSDAGCERLEKIHELRCDESAERTVRRDPSFPDAARGRFPVCGRSSREGRYALRRDLPAESMADPEGISSRPGLREDGLQRDGYQLADGGGDVPNAEVAGLEGTIATRDPCAGRCAAEYGQRDGIPYWWRAEPAICGMDNGLALELDRHGAASAGYAGRVAVGVPARSAKLMAIGNGQVPLCAAAAFELLRGWLDSD